MASTLHLRIMLFIARTSSLFSTSASWARLRIESEGEVGISLLYIPLFRFSLSISIIFLRSFCAAAAVCDSVKCNCSNYDKAVLLAVVKCHLRPPWRFFPRHLLHLDVAKQYEGGQGPSISDERNAHAMRQCNCSGLRP